MCFLLFLLQLCPLVAATLSQYGKELQSRLATAKLNAKRAVALGEQEPQLDAHDDGGAGAMRNSLIVKKTVIETKIHAVKLKLCVSHLRTACCCL